MKTKLVLIAPVFTALVSSAQTNIAIFPQLLSPTNSVLMTNAEFRVISGVKIYFKNDNGYRSFYPGEVNSNVLMALHTSIAQIAAKQQVLIDANQRRWDAEHPVPPIYTPPADDIFDRAKKRMDDADKSGDLSGTVDRIIESLQTAYSEIIENSILNGANGTQVAKLERDRDLEKKKILEYAIVLAQKRKDQADATLRTAESNQAAFNADPIGYLQTHPSSKNSTNQSPP